MACMRDRRNAARSRETVSEDNPAAAVPPPTAPSRIAKPDDTAPALAADESGERRQPPSPDLPSRRERQRSVGAGARTDDTDGALAPGTRDTYRRDWAEFTAWCRSNGADPAGLPISPKLVTDYLATMASSHGASAARRRVAAIADHHRRRGVDFSAADPAITEALRDLPGRHREAERPALAFTAADLPWLIATCRADLPGVRDRALLLVGSAGGLRRSALVAIDQHHLRIDAEGAVIAMPSKSKEVRLPRLANADICPVRALEAWLERGKIRRGAVFRGISVHGVVEERLTAAGVRHILLQRAALAKRTAHTPYGPGAGTTHADRAGAGDTPIAAPARRGSRAAKRRARPLAPVTADNTARSRTPAAIPDRHQADHGAGQGASGVGEGGIRAPADTDWLLNRLTVSGPAADVARFRVAARGTNAIPWSLDLDQEEARLLAPMASAGPEARALARQLRAVVAARHGRVLARWNEPGACPFDLHRLIPVAGDILALGEDDPAARRWLWEHWGTPQPLRGMRMREDGADRRLRRTARVVFEFRSADWTPWQAVCRLRNDWPMLVFAIQPRYDDE
jgi:site-specific recombinase XerD